LYRRQLQELKANTCGPVRVLHTISKTKITSFISSFSFFSFFFFFS